jgi:hypothetical protein
VELLLRTKKIWFLHFNKSMTPWTPLVGGKVGASKHAWRTFRVGGKNVDKDRQ